MAKAGDAIVGYERNLANGDTFDIRPELEGEAVIHNIWYGGAVEIYRNNGTNTVLVTSDSSQGSMEFLTYHITNGNYITVKNVSGGDADYGYDGAYTHPT